MLINIRSVIETLWNQRLVVATVLAVGLAVALVADLSVHAVYTANASVLMVPGSNDNEGVPTTMTKPLLSDDLPMLAQTTTVLDQVSRDMGGSVDPAGLNHLIRADVYQNSNVMTIRFSNGSPELAVKGANAVADQVVDYYRAIATTRFDSLAANIKQQLEDRQRELRRLDTQLQKLTAAYPYIQDGSGSTDGTSVNARLIQLQAERNELMAALSGDSAQAGVTSQRMSEVAPLARQQAALDDPTYRNVREQFGKDVAQLRYDQTRYTSAYPGVVQLKDVVSREQAGLSADEHRLAQQPLSATQQYAAALAEQNHAQSLVANDQAKLQQVESTIAELQAELSGSSARGTAVEALRRQRASAQNAYQLLSTRLIGVLADRAAAASTGSLMVLDRASYAGRSPYTQPAVITAAVMIVALWLAITLAFMLEAMNRRFRTLSMIESVYGSPVLGTMVMLTSSPVRDKPRSLIPNKLATQHRLSAH